MPASRFKIVVFVPEDSADLLRKKMGDAGAGVIGNYDSCSFSSKGIGRFRALAGANPTIGHIDEVCATPEERIEMVCDEDCLCLVIEAIKKFHPYEEPAFDVYSLYEAK